MLEDDINQKDLEIILLKQQVKELEADDDITNESRNESYVEEENDEADQDESLCEEPSFQCDLCGFETTKKIGVSIHASKKHKFHCVGCSKYFKTENELEAHVMNECEEVENFKNPKKHFLLIFQKI